MARREIRTRYIGSVLGVIWTFIHPLVLIFVFWVVFSLGLKVRPAGDAPFVVWLTAGLAIWFVFSEIISGSVNTVVENGNLVKKTLFHSQILPVVKIVSCLVTHTVFLLVLVGLILFQGMPVSAFYLQFLYYLLCMFVLALGISWAVSALTVFIRDVTQTVGMLLQIGFWATPIFWDITIMPPQIQLILKLNPLYYLVQGYRDSFINFSPFWTHPYLTLYFWLVAILSFAGGAIVFKRLKPHFPDVL